MGKYKICVYAICKNEEHFVDRWMDSMTEADMVVVTDTGSTDGTVEKLRSRGAVVYVETIKPWRFDVARNRSLAHVPDDIDIVVCTDLDEILRPGWREFLEKAWTKDATMANYLYNWSLKPDGTPDVQFVYFKVHVKEDYEWTCPVHEYLKYVGNKVEQKVFVDGMVLDHYPDSSKSRSSYLPLLELAVKEKPQDNRMTYYLGREYMYHRRWQDCIDMLKRYLELPTALWAEERCAAMRWIARSYGELKDIVQAYSWYYKAVAEAPEMRDAYIECAKLAYQQSDWRMIYFMTREALKIKEKSKVFVNMGYAWDYTVEDLAAIACYRLELYEEALMHAKKALSEAPDHERLKRNYDLIKMKCNTR